MPQIDDSRIYDLGGIFDTCSSVRAGLLAREELLIGTVPDKMKIVSSRKARFACAWHCTCNCYGLHGMIYVDHRGGVLV